MTQQPMGDAMPTFRFRDCDAAVRWLVDVLGCTEHFVNRDPKGVIGHGELRYGNAFLIVGSFPDQVSGQIPALDLGNASTYLVNDDEAVVEETWHRTQEHGAPAVHAFQHASYGGCSFTVSDPWGNYWTVGSYRPRVADA